MKFYLMTAGVSIIGYLAPEILAAAFRVRVPQMMNIFNAVAFGLIAASVQM